MSNLATVSCKISEQHNDHVPMTDKQIYVVGPRRLKNELLTYFLERETGAQCQSKEKIRQVPGLDDKNIRLRTQVLWDCLGKDLEMLMANIGSDANNVLTENLVSLFDVDPVLGIEEKSLALGVRGFFYEGDSLELLLKGVHAIFEGEWWVSRRIMAKCIVNRRREGSLGENGFLTPRSPLTSISLPFFP